MAELVREAVTSYHDDREAQMNLPMSGDGMTAKPRCLELFTGGGGLALGLDAARL